MNHLIAQLKETGQDHEFYPTTDEIISAMLQDIAGERNQYGHYHDRRKCGSFLDIGAGNGKVLNALTRHEEFAGTDLYAIEKSETLRNLIDDGIYIIGTDFHEQSLIDKHVDVTFCNPPYSDFEAWATKIIRESASHTVYLVIPTRWKDNADIAEALKYRNAEAEILGEYDFQNADRSARAIVNLIRVCLSTEKEDAFDRLFHEQFRELEEKFEQPKQTQEEQEEEKAGKFSHLVTGENYVKALVEMYREELKHIRRNYEAVSKLDPELLREFEVNPAKIMHCLKERMKGTKAIYWKELIGRMKEITQRLTSKKSDRLFRKLNENGNVDFTEGNIYAVVLWIIKHAGTYLDEQLIETYEEMISKANCRNYKSNQRVYEYDRWRYNQEKPTHIYLDYRLVVSSWGCIEIGFSSGRKISERAGESIRDLLTVAYNLGFKGNTADDRLFRWSRGAEYWAPGQPQEFRCIHEGKNIVLMEIKLHLNGNMHIRLNQQFALALNVEYGRIKGWIHSKGQAGEELQNPDAGQFYRSQFFLIAPSFMPALPEPQPQKEEPKEEHEEPVQLCMFA